MSKIINQIADFFTKTYSHKTIRQIQVLLFVFTYILLTLFLIYPYMKAKEIRYSTDPFANALRYPFRYNREAPRTVISDENIQYYDENHFQNQIEIAKRQSPLVFFYYRDRIDEMKDLFGTLIQILSTLPKHLPMSLLSKKVFSHKEAKKVKPLLEGLTNSELYSLYQYPKKQELARDFLFALKALNRHFIIAKIPPTMKGAMEKKTQVWIYDRKSGERLFQEITKSQIIPTQKLFQTNIRFKMQQAVDDYLPAQKNIRGALFTSLLILLKHRPPAMLDPTLTFKQEDQVLKTVKPIAFPIPRGAILVRKGEKVKKQTIWKFKAYNQKIKERKSQVYSIMLLMMVFSSVILLIFRMIPRHRLGNLSGYTIVFGLLWIIALLTFFMESIYYNQGEIILLGTDNFIRWFPFGLLVPASVLTFILSILYGEVVAVGMGMYLAFYVLIASRFEPFSFLLTLTSSITVAITARKITKRIHFYRIALYIFIIQSLILFAWFLFYKKPFNTIPIMLAVNLLVSFTWATLSQGILILLESFFNIPTTFKLIELTDLSHPLLKQMSIEAPSTFQHTMMVSNLAEKAARAIKANALLTRVGAYFHDIGKTPNSSFYIENQHLVPKPEIAEKMSDEEMAKVIISHVTDGIEIAKKHRLPQEVIDFIPEHHGDSLVSYFYFKALEKNLKNPTKEIDEKAFRYPGPKPRSKETAILMLADSFESATRSLNNPTWDNLKKMLDRVIEMKLNENQFANCPLTFRDLETIKQVFMETMYSAMHRRIQYQSPAKMKALQKQKRENEKKIGMGKRTTKRKVKA